MNTVDKVLKIALDEVGYLEKSKTAYKNNPNIIYEKIAGAGHDNYTKYGKEMHDIYPSVMDFPAYWCFVAGTMVLTDCGYKPIEELQIGDKVLDAYGKSFNTVVDIASRQSKVCEIRAYGSIPTITTPEHPFLSNKRLGVRKDGKQTELTFNPVSELKHGDNVIIPHIQYVNDLDLTYDEAWIVGYFVGDGWKTKCNNQYMICGNDAKEKEIYKHITSIHKDTDYSYRTCHEYHINKSGNERIIPLLDNVGYSASNKRVPTSILFSKNEIKQAFLDGYFTADGTKDGKFNTVSKELAFGIAKLIFDLGYGCSLREQERKIEQEIFDKRINAYRKIHIKPIIYCGAINKNIEKQRRMDVTKDNLVYVPVKYVKHLDCEREVFNITTDGNHTFIANNFAVHNCDSFCDWCFYKAYGIATAKSLLNGDFNDYTVASCGMYQKHDALYTNPKVGDQVFFTRNGKPSGCYHTGLVYSVDENYFYTVEGNTSNASTVVSNGGGVAKKKYSIAKMKGKTLFGRPKYDVPKKTFEEVVQAVLRGEYGNGQARRAKLVDEGFNPAMVQAEVTRIYNERKAKASKDNPPQYIWNYLMDKIKNPFGVAGLMGNIKAESGFNPKNLQNSFEKKLGFNDETYTVAVDTGAYARFGEDKAGYGLCQWSSAGRKQALLEMRKNRSIGDLDLQLEYLWYELQTSYKSVLKVLKNAESVKQASDYVLTKFERPKLQSDEVKNLRAKYGEEILSKFN